MTQCHKNYVNKYGQNFNDRVTLPLNDLVLIEKRNKKKFGGKNIQPYIQLKSAV